LAGLEHYKMAGEALLRAKAAAGHGKWLETLKRIAIPQQRASEYRCQAAGWDKLPPGGSFALEEALAPLAEERGGAGEDAPPVPPAVTSQVAAVPVPALRPGMRYTSAGDSRRFGPALAAEVGRGGVPVECGESSPALPRFSFRPLL
jgi:hypothetical protein